MPNKKGFVYVDVLMNGLAVGTLVVVLALMGVQSAIAIPRWARSHDRARLAMITRDLENLAAREAIHYADRSSYSVSPKALRFKSSKGVKVAIVADAKGWTATATHTGLSDTEACTIYVGRAPSAATPVRPERPGEVACTQ